DVLGEDEPHPVAALFARAKLGENVVPDPVLGCEKMLEHGSSVPRQRPVRTTARRLPAGRIAAISAPFAQFAAKVPIRTRSLALPALRCAGHSRKESRWKS